MVSCGFGGSSGVFVIALEGKANELICVDLNADLAKAHAEDIPLIANHLLEKHCVKMNKPLKHLSSDLLNQFLRMRWEGNVREMENLIMRNILFSRSDEIVPQDMGLNETGLPERSAGFISAETSYREAKERTLYQFNHTFIGDLLLAHRGNVTQAAKQCGLERQALQQIMKRYGIKADVYREQS